MLAGSRLEPLESFIAIQAAAASAHAKAPATQQPHARPHLLFPGPLSDERTTLASFDPGTVCRGRNSAAALVGTSLAAIATPPPRSPYFDDTEIIRFASVPDMNPFLNRRGMVFRCRQRPVPVVFLRRALLEPR